MRPCCWRLDLDLAEAAVPVGVGGRVGEGVEVRAGVDGVGYGLAEAVGVDEGVAAGLFGHLEHGAVFGCGLLEEFGLVFGEGGGIAGVFAAGVGGAEDR